MRIPVQFHHVKESRIKYAQPSTFFFDDDGSTGPVIERNRRPLVAEFEFQPGDIIEFCTTKFQDEFDIKHWRGNQLVNSSQFEIKQGKNAKRPRRKTL